MSMHPIQWIIIAFALLALTAVIAGFRRGRITSSGMFGWLIAWLLVIVIAIWPDSTYLIANKVGITRGADLVIYTGLLLTFFFFFRQTLRMERIERDITALARQIALWQAEAEGKIKPEVHSPVHSGDQVE